MRLSLRVVVVGGVVLGLLIPMSVATVYSSSNQRTQLMEEATAAHARVTDVLALGVSKALWDLAPEGAQPLVKSVMDDHRIVSAQVLDGQGAVFTEEKDEARRQGKILTIERPVVSGDQTIGKVKVDFSLHAVESEIAARIQHTLLVSLVQAFACIGILVLLLNTRVLGRINRLKGQANRLAEAKLEEPFVWKNSDEIGELGVRLESTRVSLLNLFTELERKNADLAQINANLESIVAERTATIKMILDHVKSGFFLIDRDLRILPGYTKSCETLFATNTVAGQKIAQLARLDGGRAAHFEACIDQVFEDIFPEEVSLELIPKRFKVGDRTLSVDGSTVRDAQGKIKTILLTMIDVTLLEQTEKENRANRAMVNILQNMAAFRDFIRESRDRLTVARSALGKGEDAVVRRELHTLKGNASAFGLEDLAAQIHSVEDEVKVIEHHLVDIRGSFSQFLAERHELLKLRFEDEDSGETLSIDPRDLEQLRQRIESAGSTASALQTVKAWAEEVQRVPVGSLLGPVAGYITKLAEQRGKRVQFNVHGSSLRVDPYVMKPIVQNLVHLLRNSVDHGLETPDERGNKPETGSLDVTFDQTASATRIMVKDDGKGIDTKRVLQKAVDLGLVDATKAKAMPKDDVERLIFSDGLSTATSVTDTSGRGVGMAAVRQAIEDAGGQILIKSNPGKGTEFVIELPRVAQISTGRRAA